MTDIVCMLQVAPREVRARVEAALKGRTQAQAAKLLGISLRTMVRVLGRLEECHEGDCHEDLDRRGGDR